MPEISLSEYLNIDKKLKSQKSKTSRNSIKIALLGSFTLNGFKETLNVKCRSIGIEPSFYVGEYNQYARDLLDGRSAFYRFKPDITFLIVDINSLLPDLYLDFYRASEARRKALLSDTYKRLKSLTGNFIRYGSGIIVVNNFEVPVRSPLGVMESKEKFGYFDLVKSLNREVASLGRQNSVFIFDYDAFASEIGKSNIRDDKMLYLADMRIAPDVIPFLCEEYLRYIRAFKGLTKKCVVVDLDNTLWGGIIGEDGLEGIKLGPAAPGNAYMEFQKNILALFQRGIILAINSNNNRDDALEALRRHPHMMLKEKHFASMKINWENKVRNLIDIAKDLNIGLDSIVFLEDDKRVRQVVKEALPEVYCPDLPEDASSYPSFLTRLPGIDSLQITHEDRRRGTLYADERRRKESVSAFNDLSQYLRHLDIAVAIKPADKFSIPRISQLTVRTNQFNFSAKRYTEKEIASLASRKDYTVLYIKVKDKYGDYGIAGVVIIRKGIKEWIIEAFLLSCRILGRNIEDAVFSALIAKASKSGVGKVRIIYKKTAKNMPARRFLERSGTRAASVPEGVLIYEKGKKSGFAEKFRHINFV